ncbi:MAG TPA: transglutaminase-like domain-containing protein [Anaerolineales bacterium]|nr:transglutaminase-like domain-containing protein [Anaerolineales bacterium]
MIQRFTRQLFTADTLGILIVIAVLQVIPFGIAASVPSTINTQLFFLIGLMAASIGFGWSATRRSGIQASAGIAALSVLLVWITGARLIKPLFDLTIAVFTTLKQVIPALQTKSPLDTTSIQAAWVVIVSASSALWMRIQTWLTGFNSDPVKDALIRSLAWLWVYWFISAWLGWHAQKRNALIALLPALTLITIVTAYSEKSVTYLLVLLVSLLLLMSIWHYKSHMSVWMRKRFDFSESIPIDMGQAAIAITFAFVLLAALTPSLSWHDLVDFMRRRNTNSAAETLGIQPPTVASHPVKTQTPIMPREHLLIGGFANSEKVVMTIQTGELPPLPTELLPSPAPRYYWRSQVYDQYLGTGWGTSTVGGQKISANTPLLPALLNEYRPLNLDVRMIEPEGKLFWSGILFRVDVPFTAQWRLRPPSDLFADQSALLQSDIFYASSNTTTYHAEAYIPSPAISDLQSATTEYPDAILEHYLGLPPALPERVRNLALDITNGKNTPYEKTKAIENYLRSNYPYDLNVPAPPADRDAVDYFLFDLKKGYCDYYATAMVVLARANGIPARFVSGYSPGTYDAPNAQYVVRELNAHSWAEVYFPGVGWVEFEPTASAPEINRPENNSSISEDAAQQESAQKKSATKTLIAFQLEKILVWISPLLTLLVIVFVYFIFIERWLYLRLDPVAGIHQIYQNFYRIGKMLTGEISRAETSNEFLAKITKIIKSTEATKRNSKKLEQAITDAEALTFIYHRSLFMNYHAKKTDLLYAWHLWVSLRYQLLIIKILLLNSKRSN